MSMSDSPKADGDGFFLSPVEERLLLEERPCFLLLLDFADPSVEVLFKAGPFPLQLLRRTL